MSVPISSSETTFGGKTVLVTGGARGMGREISLAFAQRGADVVVIDQREEEMAAVCEQVGAYGQRGIAIAADLTDIAGLKLVFDEIASLTQGYDVLINNAGISPDGEALGVDEAAWDSSFALNVKALFFAAQFAAQHFIGEDKPGKIVNTCSTYSVTVEAGLSVYCASKGAVLQITRALAAEWAKHRINVNGVGPTLIETAMTAELFADPEYIGAFTRKLPSGEFPKPRHIAEAILFLAGPNSSHVHGHMLLVDSGESVL